MIGCLTGNTRQDALLVLDFDAIVVGDGNLSHVVSMVLVTTAVAALRIRHLFEWVCLLTGGCFSEEVPMEGGQLRRFVLMPLFGLSLVIVRYTLVFWISP